MALDRAAKEQELYADGRRRGPARGVQHRLRPDLRRRCAGRAADDRVLSAFPALFSRRCADGGAQRLMRIVGLMSGTSIDAIDAALIEVKRRESALHLAVRAFVMQPIDAALRERVQALLPPAAGSTAEVCAVNVLLGEAFARAALAVAEQAGVPISAVGVIGSHGQTVYHQVAAGAVRSTLQLGAAAVIAERTGRTVVADFRPRDMAAGGQGAPLAPYLDALLFGDARS